MFLRFVAILGFLPLVLVMGGCACPSCTRLPRLPHMPCAYDVTEGESSPPEVLVDPEAELLPLPEPSETYRLLEADVCKCAAVHNAPVANMVELERHWARIQIDCDTDSVVENLCLYRDLLSLHAYTYRNTAAGTALETFYQLAGLEARKHYLLQGIEESSKTLERIDNLKSKGIALPAGVDRSAVASRLSELKDRRLQLDFARLQLNGQLQKLLGCPLDEYEFFWPQTDWTPDLVPLDVEDELALGLSTRADLRGLGLVLCKLKKVSLPVARGVLAIADSTIGSIEPREGLRHVIRCCACNKAEVPIRCKQLAIFYDETEQGATAEIKNAAYQITLLQHEIVLDQQLVALQEDNLRVLEETRNVNDTSVFEISEARGRLYEAESQLVGHVAAMKIAFAKLHAAQGVLPRECGVEPVICNDEDCCGGDCFCCQSGKQRNGTGSKDDQCDHCCD